MLRICRSHALAILLAAVLIQGCATKEEAIAVEKGAERLDIQVQQAMRDVGTWEDATLHGTLDLFGQSKSEQLRESVKDWAARSNAPSSGEILTRIRELQAPKNATVSKELEPLATYSKAIREAVVDLHKAGPFFAPREAVGKLKPHLDKLAVNCMNAAGFIRKVEPKLLPADALFVKMAMMWQPDSQVKNPQREELLLVLVQSVAKIREDEVKQRDNTCKSLLLAATYALDMRAKIVNYETLTLSDILPIIDELTPTLVVLSGGAISDKDIDRAMTQLKTYASQVGLPPVTE